MTVTKTYIKRSALFAAPYGNATTLQTSFETDTAGIMVDSDKATAVANGDVVNIGLLPAGSNLLDSLSMISDGFTAGTTASIGFAYTDGVDDANVPQDDDYFNAALDTATAARTRASNVAVKPVTLPKDAYLTLTIGGASHASAGRMDIAVNVVLNGTP